MTLSDDLMASNRIALVEERTRLEVKEKRSLYDFVSVAVSVPPCLRG
jgi:hypothetical protein